ncbi:DNA dC-_dU-editing enzyme APOBEC-3G-like [Bos javanicus]|uniref:DNA dC->dU-editing enzyme APOBEC-3G-like n=1 Tax=Bos javanicus TaxID=9906 RepID=UPI002AA733B6|nr:DNA dC->dU-editing enzyme APOBEC-3G-like [Bos javanicus]
MDEYTFTENFNNQGWPSKTYLCYEVERLDGDATIPLDEYKGFVRNKGLDQPEKPCHAELYFLGKIRSWNLDRNQHYRLTCFISWSPCYDCAQKLTTFLKENRHISLHILASRIYTHSRFGCHQSGLCELQAAGARITIMTFEDFKHCWETFVDHKGKPFQPWEELNVKSQALCAELQAILKTQQN